jgi:multidrug efflux pump subunit AcrB
MAIFGFSLNSLTLCGLVMAIGLVVDDAIIVVENVEKFLERGLKPMEATRAAMAEITTPIITITLVLAAVFVPVAFIPGMTGRLYNQFAMTIVFSFVFSAFNSLTFSPAMARLFLKTKHHDRPKFFLFRWFNAGMRWLETSYDSVLEWTAKHWWTIVTPSLGLLVLTSWMLLSRPKSFVPTEDMGYLIAAVMAPDGTSTEATDRIIRQADEIARGLPGVAHNRRLRRVQPHQPDEPEQHRRRLHPPEALGGAAGPRAARRRPGEAAPGDDVRQDPRRDGHGHPAGADPRARHDRRLRDDAPGP